MKKFFQQDKISTGLVVGLGTLVLCLLMLTVGLLLAGEAPMEHLRWYGGSFIVLILLLRIYVKLQKATVTKTLIVILFLSFIAFIYLLFQTHSLVLK